MRLSSASARGKAGDEVDSLGLAGDGQPAGVGRRAVNGEVDVEAGVSACGRGRRRGNSLRVDLSILVALPVVQEAELPVGGDLSRGHHSGMQTPIGGVRGEENGVVLLDECSKVGELLAERSLRLGLLGVLVVSGHADMCVVKASGKSGRERESGRDGDSAGKGGEGTGRSQCAGQGSKRSSTQRGHDVVEVRGGEGMVKDDSLFCVESGRRKRERARRNAGTDLIY